MAKRKFKIAEEENRIEEAEKRIEQEEKKIEQLEEVIEKKENLIEKEEKKIRKLFKITPKDKKFLFALVGAIGVVFFWYGMWGVIENIPIINNPFVASFIGLLILTLSGIIYSQIE
jgi:uncharacterized coiled-coil protein SlyX